MNVNRKISKVALLSVVVALLMGAQPVSGQAGSVQQLSITDLGTLPGGNSSRALGINNRGQVVGWSTTASDEAHAFLWEDGEIVDLETLPHEGDFHFSVAEAINNRGQVVGVSWSGSGDHAVLWTKRGLHQRLR
jgi:probable HAF family extracellular repeat protein